jgi:ribosomal protein L11 methyltransferase
MEYVEMVCHPTQGAHTSDLLISALAEVGFESFTENEDGSVSAFIQAPLYSHELSIRLSSEEFVDLLDSYHVNRIEDENWNAVWESQYEPVLIDGRCTVRAPFHPKPRGIEFDIVIMPKMSFGTAHHETTKLMISFLLGMDVNSKSLLDMGSGTGVLAILARMKGAHPVSAYDNDDWAYNNALENVKGNNFADIEVKLGDSSLLEGKKFDIILANINRNILLEDIPVYRKSLKSGGLLLMSGFYTEDLPLIEEKAKETGLRFLSKKVENNWTAACFAS